MNYYVSRTGTLINLAAIRRAGFGMLVSRAAEWRREGFDDWIADCGAWFDFQAGLPFNEEEYERFLLWIAEQPVAPKFIVLPDKVAAGADSLAMSVRWMNRVRSMHELVLIPVQDGMEQADLEPLVSRNVGVFLGGSDAWKLATMKPWGDFCKARGVHYHVARVNTLRRFGLAAGAHATTADGSSAARFSKTVPLLAAGVAKAKAYKSALAVVR